MVNAEAKNTVKDEANCVSCAKFSELSKLLDGIRRGGYVSRMSYRQGQPVNVRARLITAGKTREAGRTIIAIMFPAHEA